MAKLDPFEGFPNWYNRVPIELTLPDSTTVQGQAYIQVRNEEFIHPADIYLVACSKTVYLHRQLARNSSRRSIALDVLDAVSG